MSYIDSIKHDIAKETEKAQEQAAKSAHQIVVAIKKEIKNVLTKNPNATKISGYLHSDYDGCYLYFSEGVGHLTRSMFEEDRIRPLVEKEIKELGLSSFTMTFETYDEVYQKKVTWFGKAKYATRTSEHGIAIHILLGW